MIAPTNRTILYSLALAGLAIILTIPDVIFDFSLDLSHTLFDFVLDSMHTLLEAIEYLLDHIVEYLFHTNLQQTQLIVFYIMLLMGLFVSYGLLQLLVRFYRQCKNILISVWLEEKILISLYWLNLPLINKIKLISVIASLAYLFFLVSF